MFNHHIYRFKYYSPYKDKYIKVGLVGDVIGESQHNVEKQRHDKIIYEIVSNLPGKDIIKKSLFYEMVVQLYRNFYLISCTQDERKDSKYQVVQKIISYVKANIHRKLSLKEISEDIGYSSTYISRVFNKKLDMSLWDYMLQVKMERARYLLEKKKDISITEVRNRLGYTNIHYFNRLYKKHFGIPPSKQRFK